MYTIQHQKQFSVKPDSYAKTLEKALQKETDGITQKGLGRILWIYNGYCVGKKVDS